LIGDLKKTRIRKDAGFFWVRQAWRVARSATRLVVVAKAGDLEVKVLYTPGKGKC